MPIIVFHAHVIISSQGGKITIDREHMHGENVLIAKISSYRVIIMCS